MSSITTSNKKASVQARDFHLTFQVSQYPTTTWRDLFIQFAKNPIKAIETSKNEIHVLQGLNFSVKSGEKVGIIGKNGTGKTSLCRSLAGLYRPTAGKLKISGNSRAVFNHSLGMQPELTGRENAALLVEIFYSDVKDRRKLLADALAFSELDGFLDTPFKFYSNGMQARLCLSVVSAKSADILIMDEAFEGTDQFFAKKMSNRISNLIGQSEIVFLVSHGEEFIRNICNRVILLHHGKILYDGDVSEGLRLYSGLEPNIAQAARIDQSGEVDRRDQPIRPSSNGISTETVVEEKGRFPSTPESPMDSRPAE